MKEVFDAQCKFLCFFVMGEGGRPLILMGCTINVVYKYSIADPLSAANP